MTKSFIKEAYTNLCQDKDTLFYNLINASDDNINNIVIPTTATNKYNCKKKCKETNCAIFTYDERISSNNCRIYKKTDLSNNYFEKAEVDCQKAYDKDEKFILSSIKIPEPEQTALGVGYIEPSFFRENQDKFRMSSYYLDLVKQIKKDFEDLKTSQFTSTTNGSNVLFSDTTKQKFASLNNNIGKLSTYLDISNDMVLSRLIPDRTITLRDDKGEILKDGGGKDITIDLTSSFLTEIAFDGIDKDKIKDVVKNKKYYGVDDDGNDISGNMYDGVHDYVTNSLLKQDKEKNKLLGDLENIENNLSRSNILYLFLLFLFSLIIIVFVLYKLKFKFINDIRIIFFLAGIIAIVVLLHFLIK